MSDLGTKRDIDKRRKWKSSAANRKRKAERIVSNQVLSSEKELQKTELDDIAVEELLEHLEQKFECLKIVDKECEPLYSPTEIDKEIEKP
ncbi:hypothetical protein TNCV_4792841 [Trichonephila clavipes]|nr:hypothetical protein TNCV_4792841 [Trichonephila clavipes]